MKSWDLYAVKMNLIQLYRDLDQYISNYIKGSIDTNTYELITDSLVNIFQNGQSYFQPLNTKDNYFYYRQKLGKDYIKNLPNLNKDEVDAFFDFLYKLNVLDLNYVEFERFQFDVLNMIKYYIEYYDNDNQFHTS